MSRKWFLLRALPIVATLMVLLGALSALPQKVTNLSAPVMVQFGPVGLQVEGVVDTTGAWDCPHYNVSLDGDGNITVTNNSANDESAQTLTVTVNGGSVKTTFDVDALSKNGGSQNVGQIELPNGHFVVHFDFSSDCDQDLEGEHTPGHTTTGSNGQFGDGQCVSSQTVPGLAVGSYIGTWKDGTTQQLGHVTVNEKGEVVATFNNGGYNGRADGGDTLTFTVGGTTTVVIAFNYYNGGPPCWLASIGGSPTPVAQPSNIVFNCTGNPSFNDPGCDLGGVQFSRVTATGAQIIGPDGTFGAYTVPPDCMIVRPQSHNVQIFVDGVPANTITTGNWKLAVWSECVVDRNSQTMYVVSGMTVDTAALGLGVPADKLGAAEQAFVAENGTLNLTEGTVVEVGGLIALAA